MVRDINLTGSEIAILKALGLSGAATFGRQLLERVGEIEPDALLDDLHGLLMLGYILADRTSIRTVEEIERSSFHVNSNYLRDLQAAINPSQHDEPKRRRRRRG
jgi:hypothetical protein